MPMAYWFLLLRSYCNFDLNNVDLFSLDTCLALLHCDGQLRVNLIVDFNTDITALLTATFYLFSAKAFYINGLSTLGSPKLVLLAQVVVPVATKWVGIHNPGQCYFPWC